MASNFPGGDDEKETSPAAGQDAEKKDTPAPATQEDTIDTDDDGGGRGTPSVPDPGRKGTSSMPATK